METIEKILSDVVKEMPNALELGREVHKRFFEPEPVQPKVLVLTYREALIALAEGRTLCVKPPGTSSFLCSSFKNLTAFSRTVDREVLKTYSYTLI